MKDRFMRESNLSLDIYSRRLDIWLWLSLDALEQNPTLCSFASPKIREYLETDGAKFGSLLRESNRLLVPQKMLDWITEDERQIDWLLQKLENEIDDSIKFYPPNLIGRDFVFAKIDFYNRNVREKIDFIRELQEQWNEFRKDDVIFDWFSKKDEFSRVAAAWDWLEKHRKEETYGMAKFSNCQDVLKFYYVSRFAKEEIEWQIGKIKKMWDSRNSRKNGKLKELNDFGLNKKTIQNLDEIRKNYKFSRVEMLNALIQFEVDRGLYAKERSGT